MALDYGPLLNALHRVASATTERECLACIAVEADSLFAAYRPHLVIGLGRGGSNCFGLEARGERLGEIALDEECAMPEEVAKVMTLFAEHSALALHTVRMLDEHEHRSRRDALTGLRNYREFRETLTTLLPVDAARRCDPLSVVVIDLDRFKDINDRHGHAPEIGSCAPPPQR